MCSLKTTLLNYNFVLKHVSGNLVNNKGEIVKLHVLSLKVIVN